MQEFEEFFNEEKIDFSDPKHTYKPDSIKVRVECKCGLTHILPIVMNLNDEIVVYWRHRNSTFRKMPFGKIQCLGCRNIFFTKREAEKLWSDHQVEKKNEVRDYLKSLLKDNVDLNLIQEN